MFCDDLLHYLPGSTANRKNSVIPAQPFHQACAQVATATEDLGRIIGDPVAHHAGEILGHRDLLDLLFPGIYLRGNPI